MDRRTLVRALAAGAAVAAMLTTTAHAAEDEAVLVGAGDIAGCAWQGDEETAKLLDGFPDATVFTAGDNVYVAGSLFEYLACYGPSWGRHKARTRPAPGNHDYFAWLTGNEPLGYFDYFDAAAGPRDKGYYSYDVGEWHVVVLNGECYAIGGCGPESPQAAWLRADLRDRGAKCTAAIFHYPRFNSGPKGSFTIGQDLWEILYREHVELVISGDEHVYERFAPQRPDGRAHPTGVRQFTVGTGGALLGSFRGRRIANSEAQIQGVHGVLKLTLRKDDYSWDFVPVKGQTATDSGSAPCH